MAEQLIDSFNRTIDYLRISVTDRCNLRCIYCMNKKPTFLPRTQILTLEELAWIGRAFIELGVKKIRITGGEPLLRQNVLQLFTYFGQFKELEELTITTNGFRLAEFASPLKQAGVKRINISLDSLQPERFRQITRNGQLHLVLEGIEAAIRAGFERIKLNAVVLKNYNHDEMTDLVTFAVERCLDISFIEKMPLGDDNKSSYYSCQKIYHDLNQRFTLIPSQRTTGGPAHYYQVANTNSYIGFITPQQIDFCKTCNRVRLTTEGHLLLCLGQNKMVDLHQVVRIYPDDLLLLKHVIVDALFNKPSGHQFYNEKYSTILRVMNRIGG